MPGNLIYIAEPDMYEPGEIERFYRGLPAPYALASESDLSRVWRDAGEVTHVMMARSPLPAEAFESMPNLRAVVKWGRGVERIDLNAATRHGVAIAYTPYAVQGVAEAALLLMLALSKNLFPQAAAARRGERAGPGTSGGDLAGKTVGIIGFGATGQALARMARACGMNIVVYTRTPRLHEAVAVKAAYASLNALLAQSDYVSLHAPATPDDAPILGREEIAAMKQGAYLINTARGTLVDEMALLDALKSGKLAGAGLDVVADEPVRAENPLLALDNVIVTPHSLGITYETRIRIKEAIAHALALLLQGKLPQHIANPEVVERWLNENRCS